MWILLIRHIHMHHITIPSTSLTYLFLGNQLLTSKLLKYQVCLKKPGNLALAIKLSHTHSLKKRTACLFQLSSPTDHPCINPLDIRLDKISLQCPEHGRFNAHPPAEPRSSSHYIFVLLTGRQQRTESKTNTPCIRVKLDDLVVHGMEFCV